MVLPRQDSETTEANKECPGQTRLWGHPVNQWYTLQHLNAESHLYSTNDHYYNKFLFSCNLPKDLIRLNCETRSKLVVSFLLLSLLSFFLHFPSDPGPFLLLLPPFQTPSKFTCHFPSHSVSSLSCGVLRMWKANVLFTTHKKACKSPLFSSLSLHVTRTRQMLQISPSSTPNPPKPS